MSNNNVVTATIFNFTTYDLGYDTQNVQWGSVNINDKTVGGQVSAQAFTAQGAEGSGTGCAGSVVYNFVDQKGNTQDVTFFYNDPYIGTNTGSITAPAGINTAVQIPGSGDNVAADFSISGTVSLSYGVTATICNTSPYTLTYSSQDVSAGALTVVNNSISQNESQEAFAADATGATPPSCQGSAVYTFTDQNGNPQSISFNYIDPNSGTNVYSWTAPDGITVTADGPENGSSVAVTYTVSGTVSD